MEELAELAERAAGHDAIAFTVLMQSQMQNMYKTARAILSNESDIADAISETILTCWEKLEQLKDPAWFRTWMTRILVNKCNDLIRQGKHLSMPGDVPEISAADSGFTNVEWNEALHMLDEKYRLVLMLYYVEGYKTSEISAILEITESTVRTQLARGREKLAQAVTGKK
ncbi:MAG: sigma-70 family RNA polymerase sigma factor [Lachnospiraceae bacterium]|nr:sigma-70 family RNA polymerase sigma factor [Lachnospiraceae bacterium]